MKLSQSDLNTLCQTAIEAAKKAGQLISSYAHKNVAVNNKEAADSLASQVVTEVDVKAQDTILEVLSPTLEKYDLALLTEESVDDKSRFEKAYFWCIDPMDGTLAFTEKTPGYAVSIALVSKSGESQIGVVFDPSTQTLYHAIKGKGAFKNKMLWTRKPSKQTFTFHMDRTFNKSDHHNTLITGIKQTAETIGCTEFKVQQFAGAVLCAIWAIDEPPACYFKLPKPTTGGGSIWDFAATACIYKELGAKVSNFEGKDLELNQTHSTFMNEKGVLFAENETIYNEVLKLHQTL